MVYLTAIFRVVGSWTIFEEVQTQVKPSLQQILSDGRNDFIRRRVQRLNKISTASLVVYLLLDAQLILVYIRVGNSGGDI